MRNWLTSHTLSSFPYVPQRPHSWPYHGSHPYLAPWCSLHSASGLWKRVRGDCGGVFHGPIFPFSAPHFTYFCLQESLHRFAEWLSTHSACPHLAHIVSWVFLYHAKSVTLRHSFCRFQKFVVISYLLPSPFLFSSYSYQLIDCKNSFASISLHLL